MNSSADTLIELARAARAPSTQQVLDAVAAAVLKGSGYQTCVVNVYRPAWDDYEALVVHGSDEVRTQLLGTRHTAESLKALLEGQPEPIPGVFFLPAEDVDWPRFSADTHVPKLAQLEDPDAWRSGDALLMLLSDGNGVPLGFVSVDEPRTRMRPTNAELELLWAIAQHAEQALESAMVNRLRRDAERVWTALVHSGTGMTHCESRAELYEVLIQTIADELPFERAALYARRSDDEALRVRAQRGWAGQPGWVAEELDADLLLAVLDRAGDGGEEQCWLLRARDLYPQQPDGVRSRRNGRGPGGWDDHCLVVPVIDDGDDVVAVLVVEDPADHAVPSTVRRRAVRIVMDQATVAVDLIHVRERLEYLANHDPLTGLRNRRDLDGEILRHESVAVLVCDLDRFKMINDAHGHAVGDQVLREFGELLRRHSRGGDVAIRLGGEEFGLILPRTGGPQALEAAERLRAAVEEGLYEIVPGGVTVSIGVAVSDEGVVEVDSLLARADRSLYIAKHTGRNRVELWEEKK